MRVDLGVMETERVSTFLELQSWCFTIKCSLVSYLGYSLGGGVLPSSTETQSAYSSASADWAIFFLAVNVCVFCSYLLRKFASHCVPCMSPHLRSCDYRLWQWVSEEMFISVPRMICLAISLSVSFRFP